MNIAKFTAACHKISTEAGLSFNSVMIYYFLESILKKYPAANMGKISFLKVDSCFPML